MDNSGMGKWMPQWLTEEDCGCTGQTSDVNVKKNIPKLNKPAGTLLDRCRCSTLFFQKAIWCFDNDGREWAVTQHQNLPYMSSNCSRIPGLDWTWSRITFWRALMDTRCGVEGVHVGCKTLFKPVPTYHTYSHRCSLCRTRDHMWEHTLVDSGLRYVILMRDWYVWWGVFMWCDDIWNAKAGIRSLSCF